MVTFLAVLPPPTYHFPPEPILVWRAGLQLFHIKCVNVYSVLMGDQKRMECHEAVHTRNRHDISWLFRSTVVDIPESKVSAVSQHDNECNLQIVRSDVSSLCDCCSLTLLIFKVEVDDGWDKLLGDIWFPHKIGKQWQWSWWQPVKLYGWRPRGSVRNQLQVRGERIGGGLMGFWWWSWMAIVGYCSPTDWYHLQVCMKVRASLILKYQCVCLKKMWRWGQCLPLWSPSGTREICCWVRWRIFYWA